jgi:hypothetical protein
VGHRLLKDLLAILTQYTWQEGLLEQALMRGAPKSGVQQIEIERAQQQVLSAESAMKQWDAAFEAQAISLEEWRDRVAPHRAKKDAALALLKRLQAQEEKQEEPARRAMRLRELLTRLDEIGPSAEPRRIKKLLRQLIKRVVVQKKRIVAVEFN